MEYNQLDISISLKAPIHFQKAPEAVSKLISTALIKSGYELHHENKPKNYVFSNLGKANKDGFFEKSGQISFRSFKEDMAKLVYSSLIFYEDNIFKINSVSMKKVKFRPIKTIINLNPVFVVLKNGDFWTFNKTGEMISLFEAINKNLIRKYESIFCETLQNPNWFVEYIQVKNNKPFTYYYKGIKFFGYKFYTHPKNDEISQKLAFIAMGAGLGHKNSSVGGGYCKWQDMNGKWHY